MMSIEPDACDKCGHRINYHTIYGGCIIFQCNCKVVRPPIQKKNQEPQGPQPA